MASAIASKLAANIEAKKAGRPPVIREALPQEMSPAPASLQATLAQTQASAPGMLALGGENPLATAAGKLSKAALQGSRKAWDLALHDAVIRGMRLRLTQQAVELLLVQGIAQVRGIVADLSASLSAYAPAAPAVKAEGK